MSEDLLTVNEAARLLGRTPKRVYKYAAAGRLTTIRVGNGKIMRHIRLRREEVEQLRSRLP